VRDARVLGGPRGPVGRRPGRRDEVAVAVGPRTGHDPRGTRPRDARGARARVRAERHGVAVRRTAVAGRPDDRHGRRADGTGLPEDGDVLAGRGHARDRHDLARRHRQVHARDLVAVDDERVRAHPCRVARGVDDVTGDGDRREPGARERVPEREVVPRRTVVGREHERLDRTGRPGRADDRGELVGAGGGRRVDRPAQVDVERRGARAAAVQRPEPQP
jgi:hypothetical protein